ncbi:MAG: endolytic transglycosylase MltG [Rhodospirillaceae bacterium]|nr:endolytic transglycosylase MltG [Rhodospirillaceae bacterium]MBL6930763.1 endolytic transglycosylase MltG [Rhodospirillales bacterium]
MRRFILPILTFFVLLALVAGGFIAWGYLQYTKPGPTIAETTVYIPQGSGVESIADTLTQAGVIADPLIFRLGVRLSGVDKALKAGEYAFPYGASAKVAAEVLISGKTVVHRLTVAEGLTSVEVFDLLVAAGRLEGSFDVPLEGSILPETYHYSYGDSRADLVERMVKAMDKRLTGLWAQRADGLPLKSPAEALILASIVEKETGVKDERGRVAGVFINRLSKDMRLQSDPTVVYGLNEGEGPLGRALSRADLKVNNSYNTYLIKGLPPGPICNPGLAAIKAVLNPTPTDELYFVADGNGGHVFAKTLEEHNRNAAKWRKIRDGG